jgi:hypothetical protein
MEHWGNYFRVPDTQTPEMLRLNADIQAVCLRIHNARHSSEETEARAEYDRLILRRHHEMDRQVFERGPQTFVQAFLGYVKRVYGHRVSYVRQSDMTDEHWFMLETRGYPHLFAVDHKTMVLAQGPWREGYLKDIIRKIRCEAQCIQAWEECVCQR